MAVTALRGCQLRVHVLEGGVAPSLDLLISNKFVKGEPLLGRGATNGSEQREDASTTRLSVAIQWRFRALPDSEPNSCARVIVPAGDHFTSAWDVSIPASLRGPGLARITRRL